MEEKRLPYKQPLDYRMIKHLRFARNKTLKEFEGYMNVHKSTIARLEAGKLEFTEHYEEKLREAIKRLRISNSELIYIRELINAKKQRGYK
ncbi:helix-turn-helix domain-containing protein [Priestia megaterium]|uniref:helix-turn-helix domain-containing protein n=1 Tax=Priestia megaterium TaxID=1404 RepID=UPI000BFCB1F2|nr:helix-turn-helix transcriptional regulator [Priestia megaterium]PGT75537.1 hypothetical protein COD15_07280 [Priestia megaterium]